MKVGAVAYLQHAYFGGLLRPRLKPWGFGILRLDEARTSAESNLIASRRSVLLRQQSHHAEARTSAETTVS